MKNKSLSSEKHSAGICIGTGLVALDVVISSDPDIPVGFFAGGSCGNVLTILSYLGCQSYPIARLSCNQASEILAEDLRRWNVHTDLLKFSTDGSTPIIIHRIVKDKSGMRKHKFEFRNPEDGKYLPAYKPVLAKSVPDVLIDSPKPSFFYFDRMNRASLDLAIQYKDLGATIIFEPPSMKDRKMFDKCLQVADIIKFSIDRVPEFSIAFPIGQTLLDIETLGSRGLRYRVKGSPKWVSLAAFDAREVMDAAGAGDWCTAGIIFQLLRSGTTLPNASAYELNQALSFGQALGAINCNFEGARGAMYKMNAVHLQSEARSIMVEGKVSTFSVNSPTHETKSANPRLTISSLYAHV
jgi:sugar/nucleoside kinase (ribokinase family)